MAQIIPGLLMLVPQCRNQWKLLGCHMAEVMTQTSSTLGKENCSVYFSGKAQAIYTWTYKDEELFNTYRQT